METLFLVVLTTGMMLLPGTGKVQLLGEKVLIPLLLKLMPKLVMVSSLHLSMVCQPLPINGDVSKSTAKIVSQLVGTPTNSTMMVGKIHLLKVTTLHVVDQEPGEDGLTLISKKKVLLRTLNTSGLITGELQRSFADTTKDQQLIENPNLVSVMLLLMNSSLLLTRLLNTTKVSSPVLKLTFLNSINIFFKKTITITN